MPHYHDRFKALRAAAEQTRQNALSSKDHADAVVREWGAAPSRVLRQFIGRTADGQRVSMFSTRWPDEVREELTERAGAPLVHFRWSHSDIPFGPYEPRSTVGDRHMAALAVHAATAPEAAWKDPADSTVAPSTPVATAPVAPASTPAISVGGQTVPLDMLTTLLTALGVGAAKPAVPTGPASLAPGVRITDRVEPFLAWVVQKKTSRSLYVEHAATLRMLIDAVGNKALDEIGPTDVDLFLAVLRRWPSHASKRAAYRHLSANAVVRKAQMLGDAPVDVRTQQGYIDRLRRFFLWLEQRQEIRPGLMKGIRLVNKRTPVNRPREPFSEEELRSLYASPHWIALKSPAHFWLILLALFTGMRLRELAQLGVHDVVQHGGRWFFHVTDGRPGQRLKNRSSQRMVPLHDRIVAAGFLEYLAEAKAWGMVHLFPGLNWGAANGPGDAISDWFSRTLRKHVGIDNPQRTFHSFRHSFATFASRSGVRDGLIAELLGHDTSHNTLNTYYVALSNLPEKCWGIDRIQFPELVLPTYQAGRFETVFREERRRLDGEAKRDQTFGKKAL